MPSLLRLLWLLLLLLPAAAQASRQSTELTAGWLFKRGEAAGAADPAFDDKDWDKVTLPHTFNAGDGEQPGYYRGPAWYRRALDIAVRPGRRLFVQFDGAATVADVYLNGKSIGRHEGGHAGFRLDLTDGLVPGRNMLAVRVDNSPSRVISPLGGDFTLFGGLYRPVSLIETDEIHLDLLDHGGPGVQARATDVLANRATILVDAHVRNDGPGRSVPIIVRIHDAAGREVARSAKHLRIPARSVHAAHVRLTLPNPRRWDGVREPYLYRVVAQIGEQGDQVAVPLGVRTFRFDPSQGFILNGRAYPLRGTNLMHSARPGKGTAVTADEIVEDFAILREMGSTAVRLVHFQHPQQAYEEADRLGLVAWTEIGINSEIEDTPAFRTNAAQQLRELIAQNRNHPSVMMWGLGNEVYADWPKVTNILRELHQVAKRADPDRPTVYAHCCQADDHPKAMVTDLIGFNRYFGWYPDAKGTIGEWAERFHTTHPDRPFAVSEYGAGASILHQQDPPGEVVPASGWHPEQYQALYHEKNWLELRDKPYLWGSFVWVAFDLASAGRNEGDRRGINDKGLVTYDRKVRKDAWYWYQANWSDKPMLHITSRRFALRHNPHVEVKAYTNADAATLILNGEFVGTRETMNRTASWPITLREGANDIEIRAQSGDGGAISDRVRWWYRNAPTMLGPTAISEN
ncbi:MAG: glycoside hydrolase family 2 protein [Pseudomonadota bacterium]|nr:glycoside hydrolase family 2 protein [Pseudomonadota bacterium]